ncbi:hypothetical protein OEA41_004803 [Lepraria neglecta]|uniref:Uncharacterized protein n=1 Tax=Lepraria neglecta TaxID=209136 RepID=A0AAE0DG38_9LECA|nr:hypothetical protein OEA41_004803 [Lepraria neglecta]
MDIERQSVGALITDEDLYDHLRNLGAKWCLDRKGWFLFGLHMAFGGIEPVLCKEEQEFSRVRGLGSPRLPEQSKHSSHGAHRLWKNVTSKKPRDQISPPKKSAVSRRGAQADLELYDTIRDRQSQSRYTAKRQLDHQREAHRIGIQLRGREIERKILRTTTHENEVQEFRQKLEA